MHNNQIHNEGVSGNNGTHKGWHRRWIAISCISFIFLTIIAVILSLALKLVILAPRESETIKNTAALPSLPPPTTNQQSGKLSSERRIFQSEDSGFSSRDSPVSGSKCSRRWIQVELDALYKMAIFLCWIHHTFPLQFVKTYRFWPENATFPRISSRDSPVSGSKCSRGWIQVELDALYTMVTLLCWIHQVLPPKIAKNDRFCLQQTVFFHISCWNSPVSGSECSRGWIQVELVVLYRLVTLLCRIHHFFN